MVNNWQLKKYAEKPDTPLWEMSIPGTHDSCARTNHIGYADKCQNWSITEQLDNGIRFLDLRLTYNNDNDRDKHGFSGYDIYHGGFQHATFKPSWYGLVDPVRSDTANVYGEMVDWIKAHPSEFVLVMIANPENTASDEFTNEFWKIITSTSDGVSTDNAPLWYLHDLVNGKKEDLTYEKLKGKFVLIRSGPGLKASHTKSTGWAWRRTGHANESLGLHCGAYKINGYSTTSPFFITQNYWEHVDRYQKLNYFIRLFGDIQSKSNYTFFNWISLGYDVASAHGPEYFAEYLNPLLSEYIDKMTTTQPPGKASVGPVFAPPCLGVVVLDFPDIKLVNKIINYRQLGT